MWIEAILVVIAAVVVMALTASLFAWFFGTKRGNVAIVVVLVVAVILLLLWLWTG